jgi:cell division protein FtsB
MVVRRRWRAIVFPLLLYVVSGGVTSYFVWHAVNGHRGLKTQDEYQAKIQAMTTQLADLRAERAKWRRRVDMMRSEAVDADLLDEEARDMLGRVDKNELVVMLPRGRN